MLDPLLRPLVLRHDAFGRLTLSDGSGRNFLGVIPARLFPLSMPNHWVSLADSAGVELICIENLETLDEGSRIALERELAARDFLPVITRIVHVSGMSVPCEWRVETDRGATTFVLSAEEDIRRIGPDRILIVDSHRMRYLVPDVNALDSLGRDWLEWYV